MKKKITIPLLKNLLTSVKASVGSKMFQKLYIGGASGTGGATPKDILRNGDLSCAYYVSSLLKLFNLIGELHATVDGTVRDLERNGWKRIKAPKPGAVIVWSARKFKSGETHKHIGFFIGNSKAISNDTNKRVPQMHAWDRHPIEAIFWNAKLK